VLSPFTEIIQDDDVATEFEALFSAFVAGEVDSGGVGGGRRGGEG
jgi:hypothetical protein